MEKNNHINRNDVYLNFVDELKIGNNSAFMQLYKYYFPTVKNMVLSNKGSEDDAQDIFQDAMIVFLEKLRQENFILSASIKTYIYAVTKNLLLKTKRDGTQSRSLDYILNNDFLLQIEDTIEEEISRVENLKEYVDQISLHCQKFINDVYLKNKTISQIQKEYGYTTKHNAQNQKYKCIEQLKAMIEKKRQ
ncbi:RNA polymerase sigma factor [Chryseobacterium hispalense]|jgi:RNA polymerase sigma factor (sigma-70 family)|uniref:RNA polymerase sigma factor n=1 Tax=Chryseobacterium hispalense TaxID=1453492 RepID=UPI0005547F04|nr:sigma-70 family RNA polymerase sigma factor [Chryseobacterium hispalense]